MAAWARRLGKDLTMMHQTCKMMLERVGTYWHVYPIAEQARRSIWTEFTKDGQRIMEQVFPAAIRKSPRSWSPQGEMIVELFNGSVWRLMGSDKMEVVGAGPVGVTFSEYALAKPRTWDLVRPMLRERGGWAAFVSTVRGRNHFHDIYESAVKEGWFHDLKTVRDVGLQFESTVRPGTLISADEMMDEERAGGMPESLTRQEYLCDWTAANVGAVYGEQLEALEKAGVVQEFEPAGRVFTTWDLGGAGARGDATAIWIWAATDGGVDLVDYFESFGKPLSYYHDETDARLRNLGVQAVRHWLPFDATSMHLSGSSVLQQTIDRWGQERVALVPKRDLLNGIQAGRWLLQQKVRIHPRCSEGLTALRAYHYEWDEDRKTLSNLPEHDWSSHCADAFRYLACVARFSDEATRVRPPPPPIEWTRVPTLRDAVMDYRRESKGKARPYVPPEETR